MIGRQHYNYDGRPKVGYPNEAAARVAANAYGKSSAYRCERCGEWHIGGEPTLTPSLARELAIEVSARRRRRRQPRRRHNHGRPRGRA